MITLLISMKLIMKKYDFCSILYIYAVFVYHLFTCLVRFVGKAFSLQEDRDLDGMSRDYNRPLFFLVKIINIYYIM